MIKPALDLLGHRNRRAVATVVMYLIGFAVLAFCTLVAEAIGYNGLRLITEIFAFAGGPLLGLLVILHSPPIDKWRTATAGGALYLIGIIAFIPPHIAELTATKAPQIPWARVLAVTDMIWLVGPMIGALALACLAKIITEGNEGFTRARGSALGDARWLDMLEASKLFPPDGEVVIGEAYRPDQERTGHEAFDPGNKRTWGSGGRGPLLTYKLNFDSTHMLFFAGSGGYKTTSTVVPTALRYCGSMVVLDPAREVGQLVGPVRSKMPVERHNSDGTVIKRTAIMLDPTSQKVQGCDVLEPIIASTSLLTDAVAFARLMTAESPKKSGGSDQYFEQQALNLMTGLLVYVLTSEELARCRQLDQLRALASLTEKDLKKKIAAIVGNDGSDEAPEFVAEPQYRRFLKETLGPYVNMADQTFTGIASSVAKDTQWLSIPSLRAMVCGDSFKVSDLPNGELDVFIQMPGDLMKSYPGVCRTLIGSLMKAMEAAQGDYKKRVLFVLDEVDLLGYMSILEEARDRGRKYGITLMMMYQSVGQLEKHFGKEGATSWFEGAAFASYAAIKSRETAEQLSKQAGEVTVEVEGRSQSSSWMDGLFSKNAGQNARITSSVSLQKRPLILPHEIREMRADEQSIMVRGYPALRAGRAIYFRRPEMLAGLGQSAFGPKKA